MFELVEERRTVTLTALVSTQGRVYAHELNGRKYELERGLTEPLVVIDNDGELYLADGHHRVLAADQLDIEETDAYVIKSEQPIKLDMVKTARKENLTSIDDLDILDYAKHPLVETTKRSQ